MGSISFRARLSLFFLRAAGRLPLGFLYGVGDMVSWFLRSVMHYRKGVIYANLARSFPEKDYKWVDKVARQFYGRIGDLFAETVWFAGCTGRRGNARLRRQRLCEYVNAEVLGEIRRKRGVMVMKSHTGNWEVYGGIYNYDYRHNLWDYFDQNDVHVSYKKMSGRVSDEVFRENRHGPLPGYTAMVDTTHLLRDAILHKDDRHVYILGADQRPYKEGHPCPVGLFLNQETDGMLGGFAIAAKLGFAVLYQREERDGRGHYRISLDVIAEDATGCDPKELMRKYFDLLEADIKNDPVNWLWSHKRWRRPESDVPDRGTVWTGAHPECASDGSRKDPGDSNADPNADPNADSN